MPTATTTSERILSIIRKADAPITPRQLREQSGLSGDDMAEATARLASRREITWSDEGGWKPVAVAVQDDHG